MQLIDRVSIFAKKYPLVGPLAWILSIQYVVAQILVAAAWSPPFNWATHLISDLGNTACGEYAGRYVCSPYYIAMNISFVVLGITMAIGSLLTYTQFQRTKLSLVGFVMMALSGFGTMLVGLFPENTVAWLHTVGAFLALGVGNLSLVVLAFAIHQAHKGFRIYTFISGFLSLLAFGLFVSGESFGLGAGTMERIVSYPHTTWLIIFGLYMVVTRYRANHI